jgi:hypothetical protein
MSNSDERPAKPLGIYDIVAIMLDQIAAVSWQKLGLQHDTITGKLEPNMAEAKVAIDLVAHLAQVLESQLDEDDRRRIHGLVRDLRINYVQKNMEVG